MLIITDHQTLKSSQPNVETKSYQHAIKYIYIRMYQNKLYRASYSMTYSILEDINSWSWLEVWVG